MNIDISLQDREILHQENLRSEYLEIVWSTACISFKTLKAKDDDHELTNVVPIVKAKQWKSKMFVQSINLISCS